MSDVSLFLKRHHRELLFQVVVVTMLFLFYAFENKYNVGFACEPYRFAFFLNYLITALIISYVLLPKFYYKQRFGLFILFVFLVINCSIVIEELVLEGIYFPDTRYAYFNYLYTFIDVVPLVFILVSFKFIWDLQLKNKEVAQLKSAIQESELQFLKTQINPHFLFNNLNNLYAYAIENSKKTPDIILELSSVLRYMLYDCRAKFVSLSKEIEHLKNFTNLNKLQIEKKGEINFKVGEIPSHLQIAPLILPVFIENAFKHSTASQSDAMHIDISIDVNNKGKLIFRCVNSFLPIANNQNLSKGIGIENVKKRLDILYSKRHELDILSENNVYTVNLILQLQ